MAVKCYGTRHKVCSVNMRLSMGPHPCCNGILAEFQHEVWVLVANEIMVLRQYQEGVPQWTSD